jgi:NAD-dependent dihydropyrimidine dehydrogenase PreA subunit
MHFPGHSGDLTGTGNPDRTRYRLMPFFIADACIDVMDRSCIDECPVDCIYEGARKLYINPRECIDCGACEPACPQDAIYTDIKPPAEVAEYIEDNRRFFAELLPGRERQDRVGRRRHAGGGVVQPGRRRCLKTASRRRPKGPIDRCLTSEV